MNTPQGGLTVVAMPRGRLTSTFSTSERSLGPPSRTLPGSVIPPLKLVFGKLVMSADSHPRCGVMRRPENLGKVLSDLIEVQTASFLGEDDIIRSRHMDRLAFVRSWAPNAVHFLALGGVCHLHAVI